jgi:hypothetical protein
MMNKSPRIPLALQNVILASCQDKEVHEVPKDVANKTFEKAQLRRLSFANNTQRQLSIRNFQRNMKRLVPRYPSLSGSSSHDKKTSSNFSSLPQMPVPAPKRKVCLNL